MKLLKIGWTFALVLAMGESAEGYRPTLSKGVITYTAKDGRRKQINIGRKCADLWVAPDETIIAFIAIDKAFPGTESARQPFIERSSIYLARKANDFRPTRIAVGKLVLDQITWNVVRYPSLSPDMNTVYFSVPYTQKDWKLCSVKLPDNKNTIISDEVSYCVVWGGAYSGELLLLKNIYEPVDEGMRCVLLNRAGSQTRVDDPECLSFSTFAARWAHKHGGTCTATLTSEE